MSDRSGPHVLTGTRIRERRLALSRRQAQLARAVGISPAYLNLIEHNRRPVSPELVSRLAGELQVPPEELAQGREEARIAALREAAAQPLPEAQAAELDQAAEFIARYPGWSQLLVGHARRAAALERQLTTLSERMTRDPYLLTTLHEVLSAVTSLRSTASILVEEEDIPADWRRRFHGNLNEDSQRLSVTAQSLVAYLDSFETEAAPLTPQEEVEQWLEAGALEDAALASDAARAMAARLAMRMQDDRDALPDLRLAAAATGQEGAGVPDPVMMAEGLRVPLDLLLRRLAMLRPPGFESAGLLACDASGTLTFRRAAPGFPLPRPGESCPLWPLYEALAAPGAALQRQVVTPDGRRFWTLSLAARRQPQGMSGPVLIEGLMLVLPEPGAARADATAIGPTCRICPRRDCPARREPSILAPATAAGMRAGITNLPDGR
ncbi:short-chain fatty acyl-CoA regulator family protein [Paracoccus tibetensis]|uniref:HTH cro/C1-type domain-containing protein n=1 Tax=Paracoccus tibetensis TaxID=336292 RepID=A0A1G5DI63_9RHOB|nr:short-chain fatty acyl-CoA regulator family protein [Paracoccus tibetensis]SCY14423.1 hypothetical protein SAMN05660710_00819 [Paracoccus tibetensis]